MSKILSVRIDEELYTKCIQGEKSRKETVTQALKQYVNTRQKNNTKIKRDDPVMQGLRQQIHHLQGLQGHLNSEILYLRELHQVTMNRVLQIPQNTVYDRDPIQDMQNTGPGTVKDQGQANIITKLGNAIADYKNNRQGFL